FIHKSISAAKLPYRDTVRDHSPGTKVSPRDPSRRVRRERRYRDGLVADGNTEEREESLNRRPRRSQRIDAVNGPCNPERHSPWNARISPTQLPSRPNQPPQCTATLPPSAPLR